MPDWINFAELRKQLDFSAVLRYYKVELEPKGDQHLAKCPLPNHGKGDGKSFSANLAKGVWQCFGCKQGGNVLDFAVMMGGHDKRDGKAVRKVAGELRERFLGKKEKPRARAKRPEPRMEEPPRTAPTKERDIPPNRGTVPERTVVNQPLDFALKTLETDHPYFDKRKLTAETVAQFGLGFCGRGSLSGRIAVPLVDAEEQLVAYAGLSIDESSPRYIFPSPRIHDGVCHVFNQTLFLYNGFRVGREVENLIVVQYCHLLWPLWQAGYKNVVALMGDVCSENQAESALHLTDSDGRIWLLTVRSAEGESCAQNAIPKLASRRLCRWIQVETEDELRADHPLFASIPKA